MPTQREAQTQSAVADEEESPTDAAAARKKRWKPWWSEGKKEAGEGWALATKAAPNVDPVARAKG